MLIFSERLEGYFISLHKKKYFCLFSLDNSISFGKHHFFFSAKYFCRSRAFSVYIHDRFLFLCFFIYTYMKGVSGLAYMYTIRCNFLETKILCRRKNP